MKKRFFALLLALLMCVVMSSHAFAASADTPMAAVISSSENDEIMPLATGTWGQSSSWKEVGTFTMEGNNMTPVKTMGIKGNLYLRVTARVVGSNKHINLRVQIVEAYSEATKKTWWMNDFYAISSSLSGCYSVNNGQQIQVYFRAYDADTGNYVDSRQVEITYYYKLVP